MGEVEKVGCHWDRRGQTLEEVRTIMDGEQRDKDDDLLRTDRKTRSELRNTHLEAGREQAQRDNARAKKRNAAGPQSTRQNSNADEAEQPTRWGADEAAMKAQARSRYKGSDDSFEQDWPSIHEQLVNDDMYKSVAHIRRRL
jgi:hypothetical protein